MKPIWINKVREKQDKSGGIIPPTEIPTMKSLPNNKDKKPSVYAGLRTRKIEKPYIFTSNLHQMVRRFVQR